MFFFMATPSSSSSSFNIPRKLPSRQSIRTLNSVSSLVFAFASDNRRGSSRLPTAPNPLFVPNAKNKKKKDSAARSSKRPWWRNFFSADDDEILSSWRGDDLLGDAPDSENSEEEFEAWKRRAEAITELREAQEDARNAEAAAAADGRQWEDWLGTTDHTSADAGGTASSSSWDQDWGGREEPLADTSIDPNEIMRDEGLVSNVRRFVGIGDDDRDDDDLLFEDRVFRYASTSSAKFVAILILVPWVLDFLVHDYVLMPFLDRYVKLVPLAAEVLDVRRDQKLKMVEALKIERARFHLEVEIGKSPPLSDEEVWLELRHKAIELRDEWRLENRRAFANIWSDMVYGISLFILIYSNKGKVALLKFTGYKLLNNISNTGKAFLIILVTDIFLGYHSESGWQALVETILEHYGLEVDPAAITIFICFIPVVVDACVKLWLFKFLPRLSPNVANIFREMKRH